MLDLSFIKYENKHENLKLTSRAFCYSIHRNAHILSTCLFNWGAATRSVLGELFVEFISTIGMTLTDNFVCFPVESELENMKHD